MAEFTALVSQDHHHCTIGGEIDLATVDQLDAALADLSGDADVDCTAVTFIGSDGFHAFDRGYRAARVEGSTFGVSGMSSFQRKLAVILDVPYVV